MSQSKRGSLIESCTNVAIGYGVAVGAQVVIFPWFGLPNVSGKTHLGIGLCFTVVSLVRSYALRRLFNAASQATHRTQEPATDRARP